MCLKLLLQSHSKPKVISYAGMLDQSGFKQWYTYQKLRAHYQYTPGEVSFLIGKPPFYFEDYTMLSSGAKLTLEDIHVLADLFRGPWPQQLDFHKDEDFGVFEKRIIRVTQTEGDQKIQSRITIPWVLKRKEKHNDLTLSEEKRLVTTEEANEIRRQIEKALNALIRHRFFCSGRPPLAVYHEMEERCQWSPYLRSAYVKDVLYQQIGSSNLSLKTVNGQLYFQESK